MARFVSAGALSLLAGAAAGDPVVYGLYGTPGLIDMPVAQSAEDGELAMTLSHFAGSTRTTLSFQITPRLSGSFRYSSIDKWTPAGDRTFDRSFDLRYRLIDEGRYRPAVAIGFQDIIGTGIYAGEYIVASKHLTPRLMFSGGIGWGRLGSYKGFTNPLGVFDERFETRPRGTTGRGGQLESAKWFRGDAAFFGGISWQASERLTLMAEYSSDAYRAETARGLFEHKSPLNFGLSYRFSDSIAAQAQYLYGSTLGVGVTFMLNPRHPAVHGGNGAAPLPVIPRPQGAAADLGWSLEPQRHERISASIQELLAADGMILEALKLEAHSATLHIRNERYMASAEAIGRSARILTRVLPASIETLTIVPVVQGIPASAITLQRRDLEALEHGVDSAWRSYARARISDAAASEDGLNYPDDLYPKFTWSLGPYIAPSYFDPDQPLRLDVGLRLNASYDIAPGLILSGSIQKRLAGNRGNATRGAGSILPHVRSDSALYDKKGDPAINDLTLAYYFRPGKDLYGRITAGYLERMYGGVSAELLWKPPASRFALGGEVNYVKQRDFDQLFGFRSYEIATGHLSAYWDMGNGFHSQIDAGRYLAGDWGGTLAIDRFFANGWRIGAYATLTDVSFDDFGEGSFDKGLRFTIPLEHFFGHPSRRSYSTTVQPLTRDGGARLSVPGRLYEQVRDYHQPALRQSWGRFWR